MENGKKLNWGKSRKAQIEAARYFGYVADLNFILSYNFFLFFHKPAMGSTVNALNTVAAYYFYTWKPELQKDPR